MRGNRFSLLRTTRKKTKGMLMNELDYRLQVMFFKIWKVVHMDVKIISLLLNHCVN